MSSPGFIASSAIWIPEFFNLLGLKNLFGMRCLVARLNIEENNLFVECFSHVDCHSQRLRSSSRTVIREPVCLASFAFLQISMVYNEGWICPHHCNAATLDATSFRTFSQIER